MTDLLVPSVLAGRTRWWHGIAIGVAAGVKLTPLIFIPYLLLIGRIRQAATAAGTFVATVLVGYAVLPRDSGTYWWHGLFLPFGMTLFAFILLRSQFVTHWTGGITWRGTHYRLAELKANRL